MSAAAVATVALKDVGVVVSCSGGLVKNTLGEFDGAQPEPGQTAFVQCRGRLLSSAVFYASREKRHRAETGLFLTVDAGEMFRRWDARFASMCVHENAMLTCRADCACGNQAGSSW